MGYRHDSGSDGDPPDSDPASSGATGESGEASTATSGHARPVPLAVTDPGTVTGGAVRRSNDGITMIKSLTPCRSHVTGMYQCDSFRWTVAVGQPLRVAGSDGLISS